MKKGFTLAETLVTLTVLGVIMAIVMPLINKAKPDRDVIMFKKGLHTIQSAIGNATDVLLNEGALTNEVWADETAVNLGDNKSMCARVADLLNTSLVNCGRNGSYTQPQIITTDGMRYWGLPITNNAFSDLTDTDIFCMDRPGLQEGKELTTLNIVRNGHPNSTDCIDGSYRGLRVMVRADGKVTVDNDWVYEQDLIERSFNVQQET